MQSFDFRTPEITQAAFPNPVLPPINYLFERTDFAEEKPLTIASLFAGAGGLDLGFKKAGFKTIWANEYDPKICPTFNYNFPQVHLNRKNIMDVEASDIPDVDGIIGGAPCQSWREAGAGRGIDDSRGMMFFEFIRILKEKQPKFFLAENVPGILHAKHSHIFRVIWQELGNAGYNLSYKFLNAHDYEVPQDRHRVIIVGFHKKKVGYAFEFPKPIDKNLALCDAIFDLQDSAMPAMAGNKTNWDALKIPNHEYLTGGFSSLYMSRNRVRYWLQPSYTIQAGGRHAPLHPQAPKMEYVNPSQRIFAPGQEHLYRRLSVRECARIQTFPDNFIFKYENVLDGYKMVGNAVPVNLAYHLARKIRDLLLWTNKDHDVT